MRVLIAEDQLLLRDGLIRMLTANGFDVVATVDDGSQLPEALGSVRPDVAVVDVRLPPSFTDEGLRATIAARREVPGLPVLILSQYVERLYARELLSDSTVRSATCSRTASATCGSSSTRSMLNPKSPENSGRGCVLRPLCAGASRKHPPSKETTGKRSRRSTRCSWPGWT